MTRARYLVGDVHEVLATLPEGSVDLVLTSPPFLALRSYLPDDHPDKAKEIGSEPTPAEFIDALLDVVEACDRVLAPHGSLAFELGDTYSGSGGSGGDYNTNGLREGQQQWSGSAAKRRRLASGDNDRPPRSSRGDGWPLAKSLCLIPELFRTALVYGRNPLTGRETPRWRVRNVVRWCKPNPAVGALADKFRPATSEMVVACKSDKRWFDLDAVRTPLTEPDRTHARATLNRGCPGNHTEDDTEQKRVQNLAGAPKLDWWEIPTQGYPGSHYATWPEDLCVTPILSMCPRRVCTTCGEPSRRIVKTTHVPNRSTNGPRSIERRDESPGFGLRADRKAETVGWTDCGHDTWRQGVVLDPFAGSGTTLKIATGHGRDAIGIDLDHRNATLAEERVGPMFLAVEHLEAVR